ncbi:MAG: DUF3014 domain-containing protein [Woeseiaceae bacterium]|nr:DUF3014 domain-containing protein [Woeseiaceae bacterium]
MNDNNVKWLYLAVLIAVLAALVWIFRDVLMPETDEPAGTMQPAAPDTPAAKREPLHPITPQTDDRGERLLIPLPALDDSDGYFLLALTDIFGREVEVLIVKDGLIDRFVATIDNLPRRHVAEKVRPVGRLPDEFVVTENDGDGPVFIDPANYRRYDGLVARIAGADIDAIVDTYRRFYPLFQESYERLGYPNAYFNDRVVEVIDHLLETPQPEAPLSLTQPNVLYEYADRDLEALSAGQKLLLRMGPDNAAAVREFLRALRERITQQQP